MPDWEQVVRYRNANVLPQFNEVTDNQGTFYGYKCKTEDLIDIHVRRLLLEREIQRKPIPPGDYKLEITTGWGKYWLI